MKKNPKKLVLWLVVLVFAMFGFGFAMVPIYTVLCKVWGVNGKTDTTIISAQSQHVDMTRVVTVEFLATNNANLPWTFYPLTKKITIHPGENELVKYFARNDSDHTMIVQAIPSVSPGLAANYLKKTECFCFVRQTFKARESKEMPVLFHLDYDLPRDIHTVTLSYTLFDTAQLSKP